MLNAKQDKLIEENHNKIKTLALQIEGQTREEDTFLHQLEISLEKLNTFSANQENFTDENWQKLLDERNKLQQKLQTELSTIKDVRKTKRALSSLKGVQRHWLHVR